MQRRSQLPREVRFDGPPSRMPAAVRNVAAERDRADTALERVEAAKQDLALEHAELTLKHAELLLTTDPSATLDALATYHGAASYSESVIGLVEHYHLGEIAGSATAGANGKKRLLAAEERDGDAVAAFSLLART